jgi:thiol-disulfide isomerase/thioredoxin
MKLFCSQIAKTKHWLCQMQSLISFNFSSFNFIGLLLTLFLLLGSSSVIAQKGYEIKVKINGIKDTSIILGHHFGKAMYPDDTVRVDKNGLGVFKGKNELPQGMYIIFLPTKNYFDIVVGEDQFFSVESDTTNFVKTVKITGSKENQIFYDYQNLLMSKRDEVKQLQDKRKNAKTDEEKKTITEQFKKIDQEVKLYREKTITGDPNGFVGKFIKATQEIEVPDPPKDSSGKITDSTFQYRYYRNHYFDNFDISDRRMLYTPLYEDKVMTYIDKVVPQIPDTLNAEVDMLIAKSRTSPELFRYMMATLFTHYGQSQIMGFDAVALYIADKYYIKEATWHDTTYINKLKEQVRIKLPLTLGKVAADVQLVFVPSEHFKAAATNDSLKKNPYVGNFFYLSEINADFIILFFWEADCSHCKKATPEMYEIYQKLKQKNVEIIAIHTLGGEEGKVKWVNFVNEHKLYDWVNSWNPYDFKFKEKYDILSTPAIFILDKHRKIIAKRIGPEQCEEIINHYIEVDQKIKNLKSSSPTK